MKKLGGIVVVVVVAVLCLSMAVSTLVAAVAADSDSDAGVEDVFKYVAADYVSINDESNFDYAENVFLNTDKYDFLADQGLFMVTGYTSGGDAVMVHSSEEEAVLAYDPKKPLMVITHGVQFDGGRYGHCDYWSSSYDLEGYDWEKISLDGYDKSRIEMTRIFYEGGYNVMSFQYGRFVEGSMDSSSMGGEFVSKAEINILNAGNTTFAMSPSGEWTDGDAINGYSVAQFYAAEYIRFAERLDEKASEQEIMLVAHSMGGTTTISTVQIITELARVGQLEEGFVPSRVCLQDPFLGTGGPNIEFVAWSGIEPPGKSARKTLLACLENFAYLDIAVEVYSNMGQMIPFFAGLVDDRTDFLKLVAYTQIYLDFFKVPMIDAHNAIREWHMFSYLAAEPESILSDGTLLKGLSAATSTERVKQLRGIAFIQGYKKDKKHVNSGKIDGGNTIYPWDDMFYVESQYDFKDYTPICGSLVKV